MLRPEFSTVTLTRGERRRIFGLVRSNGTRKVFVSFTRLRRHQYPGQDFRPPRGFEFEFKVF